MHRPVRAQSMPAGSSAREASAAGARMSPRTKRICAQNEALRQYLVQLDSEFQSRRRDWAGAKVKLESQATRLQSLAKMSRYFMRKIGFKIREEKAKRLKGRVVSGWRKVTDRNRHDEQAQEVFRSLLRKSQKGPLREAFYAMYVYGKARRIAYWMVGFVLPDDEFPHFGPPSTEKQLGHLFVLWRTATRISFVQNVVGDEAHGLEPPSHQLGDGRAYANEDEATTDYSQPDEDAYYVRSARETQSRALQKEKEEAIAKKATASSALQDFLAGSGNAMQMRKDGPVGRIPKNANALYIRRTGFYGWVKLAARKRAVHEALYVWQKDYEGYLQECIVGGWKAQVVLAKVFNTKALQQVDEHVWRTRMKAFMGWTLVMNFYASEQRWLDKMVDANAGLDDQRGVWESEVERLERELERTRMEALAKGGKLPEPKLDGGTLFRDPPAGAVSAPRVSPTRRRPSTVRSR